MSQIAIFEAKCRRCGGILSGPCSAEGNAHLHLTAIAVNGKPIPQMGSTFLHPINVHACDDGGQGLADLIGYRVAEEE